MDTLKAIAKCQAAKDAGNPLMVFDWDKAARRIKESGAKVAGAGLRDDWFWTGGTIYVNGDPVRDSYTYLASLWAVPELELDGVKEPCYVVAPPDWDEHTKWPQSALDILKG